MVAHVSDFGIAKLMGEGESTMHTNALATMGYIAPEYGVEGLVSTRCDVYSYGVMVLETFTRKRPSDEMFGGDLTLKNWVQSSLNNESSTEVIDANLLNTENEQGFEKNVQCVSSVLELALRCCTECSGDRINMKEALTDLQKIKVRYSRRGSI
ncbi:PREDICTED: probable LRR receptor-like serine/threonine-protein kinase At3g47570 isoform X2 [Erythranthe guttata]|uniref:probable LRR receptor-like serine/threonine-protein kinase At3g47570 isoform X2 n=1 Tax=Erythranthe guttata TaxID=4155 RepID=UPI00064D7746|nr:PREDICTED: probable LRR receptor-like serine/threonine-protein kinase At3g47570 isoform X2 [Erythranthe guttata]|eukprot:XP_012830317.1 PREDICTED: probable LRR receptor-like serine/threonine-protein kinase At3g47570 isoform X2 [Erythranthe guttata]